MRAFSALLLSLSAHAALLAGAIWLASPRAMNAPSLVIEAPVGDVFVQEAPGSAASAPAEAQTVKPEDGAAAPAETSAAGGEASPPGLPNGEAHPIGHIEPSYPPMSRKLGEEGEAVFVVKIDAAGAVTEASLEKSSGHERLDEAAHQALLVARFQPAVAGGQTASSVKRFKIEFRLNRR
ncbi:MAG: energy transducer TonB [Bdellovibrionota bacterium]